MEILTLMTTITIIILAIIAIMTIIILVLMTMSLVRSCFVESYKSQCCFASSADTVPRPVPLVVSVRILKVTLSISPS